jgi:hypothetical protein
MSRGTNSFKRSDAIRAIRSARESGIEPTIVEIVTPDGAVIRVYGPQAALPSPQGTEPDAEDRAWQAELERLREEKPTPPRSRRR